MLDLVKRTGSEEYGRYIKALICGEPGAGKTLFSSTFPDPLVLSAEGGLMSIADRDVPYVELRDTEQLATVKKALEQGPKAVEKMLGIPVKTVVLDTIDEIQRIFARERLGQTKKEALQLQDYGWLGEQMEALLRGFRNLDMHVVFTCHVKESKDEETGAITIKPGLVGATADKIPAYVDLAVLLRAQPSVRMVNGESKRVIVRHLQTFPDAKHPWIKDRSGKLPQEFEVTFTDDYDRMEKRIYGGFAMRVAGVAQATALDPAAEAIEVVHAAPITDPDVAREAPVVPADALPADSAAPAAHKFTCDRCGDGFDSVDQNDLSRIKHRRSLCTPCFKAA